MFLFRMAVRIINYEISCTHDVSDNQFTYSQIMQCIVMLLVYVRVYLNLVL